LLRSCHWGTKEFDNALGRLSQGETLGMPLSDDAVRSLIAPFIDSDFKLICFGCTCTTMRLTYLSEVGYYLGQGQKLEDLHSDANRRCAQTLQAAEQRGTDPLDILIAFCRQYDLELWPSFRIQQDYPFDYPGGFGSDFNSPFTTAHPEWRHIDRHGRVSSHLFSHFHPGWEDYKLALLAELAAKGPAGIHLNLMCEMNAIWDFAPAAVAQFKHQYDLDPTDRREPLPTRLPLQAPRCFFALHANIYWHSLRRMGTTSARPHPPGRLCCQRKARRLPRLPRRRRMALYLGRGNTDATGASGGPHRPPLFAPDGKTLLFVAGRAIGERDIFVADIISGRIQQLTRDRVHIGRALFSPDGKHILFDSVADGDSELYLMDADGSNRRQLTHNHSTDEEPSFSPDGKRITYRAWPSFDSDIFALDLDRMQSQRLTYNGGNDFSPLFAPDGKTIAFVRDDFRSHSDIFTVDFDDHSPRQLTHLATTIRHLAWSPDGTALAFIAHLDEEAEVMLMDADGSNLVRLTYRSALDDKLSWLPLPNEAGASTVVAEERAPTPQEHFLHQNFPNPFNSSTILSYTVNKAGPVQLDIFAIDGQRVRKLVHGTRAAGHYEIPGTAEISGDGRWPAGSISTA